MFSHIRCLHTWDAHTSKVDGVIFTIKSAKPFNVKLQSETKVLEHLTVSLANGSCLHLPLPTPNVMLISNSSTYPTIYRHWFSWGGGRSVGVRPEPWTPLTDTHTHDVGILSRQTDYLRQCQSGTQSSILNTHALQNVACRWSLLKCRIEV